jgi:hypothetical protein
MIILVFVIVSVLAQWLYHAYLESGEKQATWGKQVLGLYVTDLIGNRVTFGRGSGRFFAKTVTGMIPLGIGCIMAGFHGTQAGSARHDRQVQGSPPLVSRVGHSLSNSIMIPSEERNPLLARALKTYS